MWLDKFTIRNLELFYSAYDTGATLIDVLDQTLTPMGSRMLKRWLALPLKDKQPIEERYEIVDFLLKEKEFAENLSVQLKLINDLERLISKVHFKVL